MIDHMSEKHPSFARHARIYEQRRLKIWAEKRRLGKDALTREELDRILPAVPQKRRVRTYTGSWQTTEWGSLHYKKYRVERALKGAKTHERRQYLKAKLAAVVAEIELRRSRGLMARNEATR